MIRFQPDTLGQALTRFFDMAAPDANVYVEIPAPDIRFAAIVLLSAAAWLLWRRLGAPRRPVFAFLLMLLVSAGIWLDTTGNGRYFMAMLVCAGPLAIALICILPLSRAYKALAAMLLLLGQGFVLWQQPPWDNWAEMHWREGPYFALQLGPEERQARPVTYASLSVLSYSLIAPQFPPQSRWTNLYTTPVTRADAQREDDFMRRSFALGPVKIIAPMIPEASMPDGTPKADAIDALNSLVARRNLRINGQCGLIETPALLQMAERTHRKPAEEASKLGFWTCPVAFDASIKAGSDNSAPPMEVEKSLARLSVLCPRFFPPGETSILRLKDGWLRHYATDTRVYVLDNGEVWYRFWRSLNPVLVGSMRQVLTGEAAVDCSGIRGSDGAWRTGAQ